MPAGKYTRAGVVVVDVLRYHEKSRPLPWYDPGPTYTALVAGVASVDGGIDSGRIVRNAITYFSYQTHVPGSGLRNDHPPLAP